MNAYNKAAAMFGLPPQPVPGAPAGGFTNTGAPGPQVGPTQPGTVFPNGSNIGYTPGGTGYTPVGAQAGFQAPPAYSLASFMPPGAKPTTGSSFGG